MRKSWTFLILSPSGKPTRHLTIPLWLISVALVSVVIIIVTSVWIGFSTRGACSQPNQAPGTIQNMDGQSP